MGARLLGNGCGKVYTECKHQLAADLHAVVVPRSVSAVGQDEVKDACSGVHLNVHSPPVAMVWQLELRLLQRQRVAVSGGVHASLHFGETPAAIPTGVALVCASRLAYLQQQQQLQDKQLYAML